MFRKLRPLPALLTAGLSLLLLGCRVDGEVNQPALTLTQQSTWPTADELILFHDSTTLIATTPDGRDQYTLTGDRIDAAESWTRPHLWAVRRFFMPDGTRARPVVPLNNYEDTVRFSTTANLILYRNSRGLSVEQGSRQIDLLPDGILGDFSPNGRQIVYAHTTTEFVVPDEAEIEVPDDFGDPAAMETAVAANRDQVEEQFVHGLSRYDLDAGTITPLLDLPAGPDTLAWSPTGDQIAYTIAEPFLPDEVEGGLYLTTVDGAEPRRLSDNRQLRDHLYWSPSGRWLAVWDLTQDNVLLFDLINDTQTEVDLLNVKNFTWSPTTDQLVVIAQSSTRRQWNEWLPVLESVSQYDLFMVADPADPDPEQLTDLRFERPDLLDWIRLDETAYAAARPASAVASSSGGDGRPAADDPTEIGSDDAGSTSTAFPVNLTAFNQRLETERWTLRVTDILTGPAADEARVESAGQFGRFQDPAPPGETFVVIQVEATNTTGRARDISFVNFVLQTDAGLTYPDHFFGTMKPVLNETAPPDETVAGWLTYLIPADERPLLLKFNNPARTAPFVAASIQDAIALQADVDETAFRPDMDTVAAQREAVAATAVSTAPDSPAAVGDTVMIDDWVVQLTNVYTDPKAIYPEDGYARAENLADGQTYLGFAFTVQYVGPPATIERNTLLRSALEFQIIADGQEERFTFSQLDRFYDLAFAPGATADLFLVAAVPTAADRLQAAVTVRYQNRPGQYFDLPPLE